MTEADIIAHWRKGTKDALEMANAALKLQKHDHALFNCHLAIEKTLKAAFMEKKGKLHPKIHDLRKLALLIGGGWTQEEEELFDSLSSFSVAARYDDPPWAQQYATSEHARQWITRTMRFLSQHLS